MKEPWCTFAMTLVFGSTRTPEDSTLDIVMIKDSDTPRYKRSLEIRPYLRRLKIPIDLVVHMPDEVDKRAEPKTAFVIRVVENERILWPRESFRFKKSLGKNCDSLTREQCPSDRSG